MIGSESDREKLEQLYFQYRSLMYYLAFQITKNQEDAEDAVHQAVVYLIDNLEKVGPVSDGRTRSFLSIITEHKAIDLVRKRRPVYELSAAEYELAGNLPDDGDELLQAMAKLPKRYQDILLLRYDNGYSVRELAKMLDMSYGAARKLLWRAKEALREILSKEVAEA